MTSHEDLTEEIRALLATNLAPQLLTRISNQPLGPGEALTVQWPDRSSSLLLIVPMSPTQVATVALLPEPEDPFVPESDWIPPHERSPLYHPGARLEEPPSLPL